MRATVDEESTHFINSNLQLYTCQQFLFYSQENSRCSRLTLIKIIKNEFQLTILQCTFLNFVYWFLFFVLLTDFVISH